MNLIIESLNKLNASYKPYSHFWNDWVCYEFNGLTHEDIYFLNIFRSKNFKMNIEDSLMFYFRKEIIQEIIFKLEEALSTFKLWLVKEWQRVICLKALEDNFLRFYNSKLNNLHWDRELINILKEFKLNTLSEIVSISDEKLSTEPYFEIIYRFSLTLRQKENTIKDHKMEVMTIN